jgi:hypothetical protein
MVNQRPGAKAKNRSIADAGPTSPLLQSNNGPTNFDQSRHQHL